MNAKEIKRSALVMAIGYVFLSLFCFISLKNIKGLEATEELDSAFYVGFTLLTVGSFISDREHKYFKACIISFLCLDLVIFGYLLFGKIYVRTSFDANIYDIVSKIITAIMNAGLALSNGLYVNGVKELFTKKKNKRLFTYSLVIEYGVTGLLLISTITSFIDFGNKIATIGVDVALNLLIYLSYAVFMFVIFFTIGKKHKDKQIKEKE